MASQQSSEHLNITASKKLSEIIKENATTSEVSSEIVGVINKASSHRKSEGSSEINKENTVASSIRGVIGSQQAVRHRIEELIMASQHHNIIAPEDLSQNNKESTIIRGVIPNRAMEGWGAGQYRGGRVPTFRNACSTACNPRISCIMMLCSFHQRRRACSSSGGMVTCNDTQWDCRGTKQPSHGL